MAKLYIPTTTLNFNNIFSSESISPASFYVRRNFGYKRFDKVACNNLENSLLIYSKCPVFDIPNNGLDDYPMVFEIDARSLADSLFRVRESNGLTVYQLKQTVYLNPFTLKLYFRTKQELKTTLSKAELSLETKLVKLYARCFVVGFPSAFDWSAKILGVIDDCAENESIAALDKDMRINRIKGAAYGYVIGAYKSLDVNSVALAKSARQIRNIVSSILNSQSSAIFAPQREQFDASVCEFKAAFDKIDRNSLELNNKIKRACQTHGVPVETVFCFFEAVGISRKDLQRINNLCPSFDILDFQEAVLSCSSESQRASVRAKMDSIDRIVENVAMTNTGKRRLLLDEKNTLSIQDLRLQHLADGSLLGEKAPAIVIALVNEYLSKKYEGPNFAAERVEIALAGGNLIKSIVGDDWEISGVKGYINGLLSNIQNGQAFDISSVKSPTLRAFAAFILKGDDPEKLMSFLVSKGVSDFRVPLCLWGSLFGFAKMPKTISDIFYNSEDPQYSQRIYNHLHWELHHIMLDRNQMDQPTDHEVMISKLLEDIPKASKCKNEILQLMIQFGEPKDFLRELKITNHPSFKGLKTKIQNWFNDKISLKAPSRVDECKKTNSGVFTAISPSLGVPLPSKKDSGEIQGDLFIAVPTTSQPVFYKDDKAWDLIDHLIGDRFIKEEAENDLQWFQQEWGNPDSKYYGADNKTAAAEYRGKALHDRTNGDAITAYMLYLGRKKYASRLSLDQIEKALRKRYH